MRGDTNASNIGGTVGDDTHPIKIVDNVPTPVANALLKRADIITGSYAFNVSGQTSDYTNLTISNPDNRTAYAWAIIEYPGAYWGNFAYYCRMTTNTNLLMGCFNNSTAAGNITLRYFVIFL